MSEDDHHGGNDGRIASLRGMGGNLVLYPDRVVLMRSGFWFTAINLFEHLEREVETVIHLRSLVAVHLVRSLLLVQFLRFTYAGCPTPTGHYLRDAFAENSFMFSLVDNRPLLGMMHRISRATLSERKVYGLGDWL